MHNRASCTRHSALALAAVPLLAIAGLATAAGPATAHVSVRAGAWVRPGRLSAMDCNGWSPKYPAVTPLHRMLCADPHGPLRAQEYGAASAGPRTQGRYWSRFGDNGHYVGHDEPSVKFISGAPNSGNTMTYYVRIPRDPAMRATNSGSVVQYGELSPAPWFGLPLCDPGSYPQNPCTPDSDTNSGSINDPKAAGSAFMELQFYPPGFAPFAESISCSRTQWCAAMTIDSLESKFNFVGLNPNCEEPQNFAFLARNGRPAGPPGPQTTTAQTYIPDKHTLMMNPGDVMKVSLSDPAAGFTTRITDLTTGRTGWMTASAGNGFMSTDFRTCAGIRHTFHAEYATALPQNQVPWTALQTGVLMTQEAGHSEACFSLTHPDPVSGGSIIVDKHTFDTCVGSSEGGTRTVGEGPCDALTGICMNATTQGTKGPVSCPSRNFASGKLCEFADGICLPQGTRTVTIDHRPVSESSPVNFCQDNRFQNGDLDFDGLPYQSTSWPNGSPSAPTSFRYIGPFDQAGNPYPLIQFETDVPASESLCDIVTGHLCTAPPLSAKFYPFWTLTSKTGQNIGDGLFPTHACVWNFGNTISGVTTRNLNRTRQYGAPAVHVFGGTMISAIRNNPEIQAGRGCTPLVKPR